jgi:excisionase family DNA binding protein
MATISPPHNDLYRALPSDSNSETPAGAAMLVAPDGGQTPLSLHAYTVLTSMLRELQAGRGVQVVVYDRELTTQQAADLLNVSRQYLIRLLEAGAIPHTKVGTHRRLQLQDVLAYRQQRSGERRESLARLTRASQEMGEY